MIDQVNNNNLNRTSMDEKLDYSERLDLGKGFSAQIVQDLSIGNGYFQDYFLIINSNSGLSSVRLTGEGQESESIAAINEELLNSAIKLNIASGLEAGNEKNELIVSSLAELNESHHQEILKEQYNYIAENKLEQELFNRKKSNNPEDHNIYLQELNGIETVDSVKFRETFLEMGKNINPEIDNLTDIMKFIYSKNQLDPENTKLNFINMPKKPIRELREVDSNLISNMHPQEGQAAMQLNSLIINNISNTNVENIINKANVEFKNSYPYTSYIADRKPYKEEAEDLVDYLMKRVHINMDTYNFNQMSEQIQKSQNINAETFINETLPAVAMRLIHSHQFVDNLDHEQQGVAVYNLINFSNYLIDQSFAKDAEDENNPKPTPPAPLPSPSTENTTADTTETGKTETENLLGKLLKEQIEKSAQNAVNSLRNNDYPEIVFIGDTILPSIFDYKFNEDFSTSYNDNSISKEDKMTVEEVRNELSKLIENSPVSIQITNPHTNETSYFTLSAIEWDDPVREQHSNNISSNIVGSYRTNADSVKAFPIYLKEKQVTADGNNLIDKPDGLDFCITLTPETNLCLPYNNKQGRVGVEPFAELELKQSSDNSGGIMPLVLNIVQDIYQSHLNRDSAENN